MKTTMCSILLRELLLSAIVSNNYLICSLDNRQSRNEGAITSAMASNREGPEPERTRIAGRRFVRCFRAGICSVYAVLFKLLSSFLRPSASGDVTELRRE